jgi:putative FmdB family regulatory protein
MLIEFRCTCGNRFEKLIRNSRAPFIEQMPCPKCGSDAPRQLSAPGGIRGGWFATTYNGEKP